MGFPFIIFRSWQKSNVSLSDHIICVIKLEFVFSFEVDCDILFVWEPLLAHGTLESVLYPTLEAHVSVKVVVPVVTFTTLLALE